jgi:hypothetical protein
MHIEFLYERGQDLARCGVVSLHPAPQLGEFGDLDWRERWRRFAGENPRAGVIDAGGPKDSALVDSLREWPRRVGRSVDGHDDKTMSPLVCTCGLGDEHQRGEDQIEGQTAPKSLRGGDLEGSLTHV